MMLMDVVYNHFGPEGNYLHACCPEFFNPAHQTPWGAAINFDGEGCRTVRELLALRRRHLVPRLRGAKGGGRLEILNGALRVEWILGDGARLRLLAYFGAEPVTVPLRLAGEVIYCHRARPASDENVHLEPGGVHVLLVPADV